MSTFADLGYSGLAAFVFGIVGMGCGLLALAASGWGELRRAHALAIAALVCAAFAPTAALAGRSLQFRGRADPTLGRGARAFRDFEIHEALRSAARFGLVAGLSPFAVGLGAAYAAWRRRASAPDVVSSRALLGTGTAAALLLGGTAAAAHRALPPDISPEAAILIDACDAVRASLANCRDLRSALDGGYWVPADRFEWPRHFASDPRLADPEVFELSTRCVRDWFENAKPDDGSNAMSLLGSPLLVDDALHEKILAVSPLRGAPHAMDNGNIEDSLFDAHSSVADPGELVVRGRLPKEVIVRIFRQSIGRLRHCYEEGLKRDAQSRGKVVLTFVIDRAGTVQQPHIPSSALKDREALACLVRELHGLQFPQPEGGDVSVTYPIDFRPRAD